MKVKKGFGVLFICLGCMAAFIGIAAAVLPMIQNDQLRLVLSSFAIPDDNLLVNAMNAAMTYALRNCYLVMLVGAGVALLGVLLTVSAGKDEPERASAHGEARPQPRQTEPPAAWRTSKAADAAEHNPFAARMANDMLAYRAASRSSVPVNTFAPAVQKNTDETAAPADGSREEQPTYARVSPYARPVPVAAERQTYAPAREAEPIRSFYVRPEPVAAEGQPRASIPGAELIQSPYTRPEPVVAEGRTVGDVRDYTAPGRFDRGTAAPSGPALSGYAPSGPAYAPAETPAPADAPSAPSADTVPDYTAPGRSDRGAAAPSASAPSGYAPSGSAYALAETPSTAAPSPAPPAQAQPRQTPSVGWATPAEAGWRTPVPERAAGPAPSLTAPPTSLPDKAADAPPAPSVVRIKSTMGKHTL